MGNRIKIAILTICCIVAVCFSGCFPEDSLDWSADGLFGLLRSGGALYLVDGQTGALTPIEPTDVGVMPDISDDGSLIAYTRTVSCKSLDEGFRLFPKTVVEGIKRDARELQQQILAGLATLSHDGNELKLADSYRSWVTRYLCENADPALTEKVGQGVVDECKAQEIRYSRLIVTRRSQLDEKQTVVTLPADLARPRFSPDNRHIAYLAPVPNQKDTAALLVAARGDGIDALEAATAVAIGYDWRPDSRALAYLRQDSDPALSVLEEKVVAGDDGRLLVQPVETAAPGSLGTSRATGPARHLAGTLFQPMTCVAYAPQGRLLFSSATITIPTTQLDEPRYSVFCYDNATGTVTEILPAVLRGQASQNLNFFRLSGDGKRLLVPLRSNRFAIYELGAPTATFPLPEAEGFGSEELPAFLPAWKGNSEVTCLVSEKSHYLTVAKEQARRKEILSIGLDAAALKVRILSESWPDNAMPKVQQ